LSRIEERKNFLENGREVWGGGREDGRFTPRVFVVGKGGQTELLVVVSVIIAKD